MGCWRTKASYFKDALKKIHDLDDLKKSIIQERYVRLLESYERRCNRLSMIFHTARILITVGSLVVPALLSIQYTNTGTSTSSFPDSDSLAYRIYWATWVLSLLVTTSNGVINVFKLDKKYYFIHTTYEQLRSEGWQYIGLTGRYSGLIASGQVSHDSQFIYFCHMVEKIKMKQVEEEYYKLSEAQESTKHPQPQSQSQALVPMSPLKPVTEMGQAISPDLLKQLLLGFKSKDSVEDGTEPIEDQTTVSVSTDLSGNTITE
jgi:hypothetical protein